MVGTKSKFHWIKESEISDIFIPYFLLIHFFNHSN